jgi:hypothetical protein
MQKKCGKKVPNEVDFPLEATNPNHVREKARRRNSITIKRANFLRYG